MDDVELATHVFHMFLAKWQTQYDLIENITPISTRALLLALENIENNTGGEYKAQSPTKMKGADGKCKLELIKSCIPKKPKKVGWTKNIASCARITGGVQQLQNA